MSRRPAPAPRRPPPRPDPKPWSAAAAVLTLAALVLWGICLRPGAPGAGGGASGRGGAGGDEVADRSAAAEGAEPAAQPLPEPPQPGTGIHLASSERAGGSPGGPGNGAPGSGLGTGDLSFRLTWKPAWGDLDLHVVDPKGHHLSHLEPNCPCTGTMDRDDTVEGGPENIFWPHGAAPKGVYRIWVEYYAGSGPEQFTVEVRRGTEVTGVLTGTLQTKGEKSQEFTPVF